MFVHEGVFYSMVWTLGSGKLEEKLNGKLINHSVTRQRKGRCVVINLVKRESEQRKSFSQ